MIGLLLHNCWIIHLLRSRPQLLQALYFQFRSKTFYQASCAVDIQVKLLLFLEVISYFSVQPCQFPPIKWKYKVFSIWSWLSLLIFLLWWSSLESSICFCPWNMHIKVVCQRIHLASFIRWSTSCGFFLPRCHTRHSTMVIHCPVCGWWYHVIMAGTLFTNLYVISLHEPNLCVWLDHEVQELETFSSKSSVVSSCQFF